MAGSAPIPEPYIQILEPPAPRSHRFRYEKEVEGRSAGAIVGIHSSAGARTYPTIKVMNYSGPCYVVVSCVTADGPPYRPHPHKIIGQHCNDGVFCAKLENPDMTYSFTGLGIECVKRQDVENSLKERESRRLDPFGTGFSHQNRINLSVLRLCFQVFIPRPYNTYLALTPVVSGPIRDKKAVMSNLSIAKLSHYSAPVTGDTEVILLCERISRTDVQIWFFEIQNSRVVWEARADFGPTDVHKQVAISFRTPRYRDLNILHPVQVYIQLGWSEEQERGNPVPFQFHPRHREMVPSKRRKVREIIDLYSRYLQDPGSSDGAAGRISGELARSIPVPRARQQQNVQYEGISDAVSSSYPPESTSSSVERKRAVTSQTQPAARLSASFGTPVQSTAYTVSSKSLHQSLGISEAVSNSYPQTSSSFVEARTLNLASQIEESVSSTSFEPPGFYSTQNNSFPPQASFAEAWTSNLTSQTNAVAGPPTSFLQTHDRSTLDAMSPVQIQSPETLPSIPSSPMTEQQFEFPELNFGSETHPGDDDITSFLLSGLSSVALDYDVSRNLNISQNFAVDSLGS